VLTWPDEVLCFFTFATLAMELVGPALLFLPVHQGALRTGLVVAFIGFHFLGLGAALDLGNFPFVCSLAWLALLPPWFWARFESGPAQPERTPWAHLSPWPNMLALLAVFFALACNLWSWDRERFGWLLPPGLHVLAESIGIGQSWWLFAPKPMADDGWYVVVAELEGGGTWDPYRGAEVDWDKPELVSTTYRNERWRKYLVNLVNPDHAHERPRLARYLFEDWNAHHPDQQARRVEVYFMLERTLPARRVAPVKKVLMAVWPPEPDR
jgi:hypothetical protein